MSISKAFGLSSKAEDQHPKGLYVLFFSELWERFSHYGIRALVVLYMTKEFLFNDTKAFGVYAAYMSLVYAAPIIGGYLADTLLGMRKAIVIGALFITAGNVALVFGEEQLFYIGLALIITGTGFFKSNISSLLGSLYKKGDPKRDAGFTIFYVGINIGGFLSPFICGYIGENYGWNYGFGLAAIGMLLGLATFMKGVDQLEKHGLSPHPAKLKERKFGLTLEQFIVVASFFSVPAFMFCMYNSQYMDYLMPFVGVASAGVIFWHAFSGTPEERSGLLTLFALMFFYCAFFALFEQAGSSITLFTERNVDRSFMGWELKTSMLQSLNPFFIMLLGPLFAKLWTSLARTGKEIYPPMQFFLGILQLGLGFIVLAYSATLANTSGLAPLWLLVVGVLLHTTGELCISPIGLSVVTKLAPQRVLSMMMGIWFVSVSFAHYLAGIISKLMSVPTVDGKIVDATKSLSIYGNVFEKIGYGAGTVCLALLLLVPVLRPVFDRIRVK